MDILTLGKMNAMARDVDVTLEYLANATFQGLKDVCDVQVGMQDALQQTADEAVALIGEGGPNMGVQTREFYNDCARGCHCMYGCDTTWTVPQGTKTLMFEAWGGGGAGAGHCCQGCWCDMASCGGNGGFYARKTICRDNGDYADGDTYSICIGAGGNGTSHCWTVCCDAPRGCATYVYGPGLCNFCAVGGRGGYNIFCTCQCNLSHCFGENAECHQMIMGQTNQCGGLGVPSGNVDYVNGSTNGQYWHKEQLSAGHCDCGGRFHATGQSEGLSNSVAMSIGRSIGYCGCETHCYSFRHAGAGINSMKSYCGSPIGHCNGTPGRPGLMKITYA